MAAPHDGWSLALTLRSGLMGILAAALVVVVPMAQGGGLASKEVDLPNGPAKPGFDITRFSNAGNGAFETFYVTEMQLLREALSVGKVADDTRLLVTDTAGGRIALLTEQMAFHHIAQGRAGGKDWLLSF